MYAKSFGVKVIFSAEEMLSTAIVSFFDMYDAIMTSFSDCLYADMGSFRSKRQRLPRQTGNLEFIQKRPHTYTVGNLMRNCSTDAEFYHV